MFGFVWQELRSRYTVCTQRESSSSTHALTLTFESSRHSTRAISSGVPRQFSCAIVCGCSSLSFDGEGSCCLCLQVLVVLHGCLWAVVAVCALFEVVDGGSVHLLGDMALPHPSCCGGCGRQMCVAATIDDRGDGGEVTVSGCCRWWWWWFGGGKE